MSFDRRDRLLLAGSLLIAVSGGIHARLHREAYRDIHVDRILGIDFAGSFVLAVAAASILSTLLVVAVLVPRLRPAVTLAAIAYGIGSIVAYGLSRTIGVLGFEEERWIPEAAISKPVELAAVIVLAVALLMGGRMARTGAPVGDEVLAAHAQRA